jgi:glyoxylase-like metal-dependent hydrolase (beta-lactamase superfamily II)
MGLSKKIRNTLLITGAIMLAFIITAVIVFYPVMRMFTQSEIVQYDSSLTILIGSGNTIVLNSGDGTVSLIVDTKMASASESIIPYVTGEIVYLVNTHLHSDHIGGNKHFPGARVIAGGFSRDEWKKETGALPYPEFPIMPGREKVIQIGDETVIIRNMGQAHSQHDCIVYLQNRKVLITGDILFEGMHPVMFSGISSTLKWKEAIERILSDYEINTVIPGHGPISGPESLNTMIAYFEDVENVLANRASLREIAAKYRHYRKIPFVSGLGRTISLMRREKAGS